MDDVGVNAHNSTFFAFTTSGQFKQASVVFNVHPLHCPTTFPLKIKYLADIFVFVFVFIFVFVYIFVFVFVSCEFQNLVRIPMIPLAMFSASGHESTIQFLHRQWIRAKRQKSSSVFATFKNLLQKSTMKIGYLHVPANGSEKWKCEV